MGGQCYNKNCRGDDLLGINQERTDMKIDAPVVTVLEAPDSRQVTTSKGAVKTIYFQRAQVETSQMRVGFELEIDDPTKGHAVGKKLYWNLLPDLVPGRFGIETKPPNPSPQLRLQPLPLPRPGQDADRCRHTPCRI